LTLFGSKLVTGLKQRKTKMKKQNNRATLALLIFAVLILLFLGGTIARGFALGNKALIDVRDRFVAAVSAAGR
jgi:Ca2+/H+ antiporter